MADTQAKNLTHWDASLFFWIVILLKTVTVTGTQDDLLSGDSSQGSILRDPDMTSLENKSTLSVTGTQDRFFIKRFIAGKHS